MTRGERERKREENQMEHEDILHGFDISHSHCFIVARLCSVTHMIIHMCTCRQETRLLDQSVINALCRHAKPLVSSNDWLTD